MKRPPVSGRPQVHVRRYALPSANTYYDEDGVREQHVASLARIGRTLQGRANVETSH